MSVLTRRKSFGGAMAVGAVVAITAFSSPAYADGTTLFQGRTEGGSLIVKSGDIIACAGVGDVRVADTTGTEHRTDGAGTTFTTPAGAHVETLHPGTVKVTFHGASADVTCGPEEFPTTSARVPKGPSLAGVGGGVSEASTVRTVGGAAVALAGGTFAALTLYRRRTAGRN
ncbi:hypothetical protein ACIA8O_25560 [Kitasatospora sp. NPDC051853]|uniref:hypothetical protein n=1 Tax=Kitasatospora sp. NPDC051853 TaxID=3364058 RepID=UPI0037A1D09C